MYGLINRRGLTGLAIAVCLTGLTAQCGVPGSRGASLPDRTAFPVPVAARPWHTGMPQLGINVSWIGNAQDSAAVIRGKAERIIRYSISLHANSIALTFPVYMNGAGSDTVYADQVTTPSPAHIGIFLAAAAANGIRVTVRPVLGEGTLVMGDHKTWRGGIEPLNRSSWFDSYQELLVPYARIAQSGNAATFVIGVELNSLQHDGNWTRLVQAIRAVYHGELAYDENWDRFQSFDRNLPVPAVEVDAYPGFPLPDSASVSDLTRAWENWLSKHGAAVLQKTVLSEVGIAAAAGAYPHPWVGSHATTPIVTQGQADWYAAVCRAFSAEKLAGIYWWEVNFDADPTDPAPFLGDRFTFLDRPAQYEVSSCFAAIAASTSSAG